jgi:uncharacterized protein (TIGR02246 family)
VKHLLIALIPLILFCASPSHPDDAEQLAKMIAAREKAMIEGDVDTAMSQFNDDATWINSQGYFFEGKQNVLEFHGMLAKSETRGYTYEAGSPKIRLLDASNAIAYYSWKMFWFDKNAPDIIVNEEIGLMTLTAQKRKGVWRWIAVTNQHTPTFYESIDPVTIHDE